MKNLLRWCANKKNLNGYRFFCNIYVEELTLLTRTKTSIGYAIENDREKIEREGERERKVEGEI